MTRTERYICESDKDGGSADAFRLSSRTYYVQIRNFDDWSNIINSNSNSLKTDRSYTKAAIEAFACSECLP